MSMPTGTRFTVAEVLRDLRSRERATADPAPDPELVELLGWFRAAAAIAVRDCPPEAVPLRLPKARIGQLLACERGTLASLADGGMSEPIVRGRVVDLVVAQHVSGGLGPDPAADLQEDLLDALAAADDRATVAWLDDADDDARARIWAAAQRAATSVAGSWGAIPREWWPRAQEQVAVELADGVLVLGARFDLALGGPPTGLPLVIVEVKAGSGADRHRADLLWYGLLAALRHGTAPAVVATWTADDDGLVPVPVTVGALEAAARRGLAALDRLVALARGAIPAATPHPGCRWCADRESCGPGQAWLAANPGRGGAPAGATPGDEDEDDTEWAPGDDAVVDDGSWA